MIFVPAAVHLGYSLYALPVTRIVTKSAQITQAAISSSPAWCHPIDKFILRLPCKDALLPNQITNEVAFKRFVASRLPHIPVPRVYNYRATDDPETSFIVEEFINATPLNSTWMTFTESQKDSIAHKLAIILVDLVQVRFDMIRGLDPEDFVAAPTVEGSKLFKGRGKFHKNECYPIGPYKSTKDYILACYDNKIYYYTHASEDDIDTDLFKDTSVTDFVEQLNKKRAGLAATDMTDEPFVLIHGDFHGRNIMMKGDQVAALIDWEFAGSYPLSESLSDGGINVVEAKSEELDDKNTNWDKKIRRFIRELAIERKWEREDIDLLMGDGDPELGRARSEMFP
jgi:hypothetical protein